MYQNVTDFWWIGTPNWQQRSLYSPLESLDEIGSFICTAIRPEDRLKMQPWHSCFKSVTKLRWKFPVVFVRTCSTGLLRPYVNMFWRSSECGFLTRDLWHWVCLRDVNGAEGGTLPPADSIVIPQVLSLTLELYLSALVKFGYPPLIWRWKCCGFSCLQVLMSLRLLGYCK